jgi:hypothetical protein
MPQVDAHPYFEAVPTRALAEIERAVVVRLVSGTPEYAEAVPSMRVVGRCGCGSCPTVFFQVPRDGMREWDVAHFVGREPNGAVTGAVLMASAEGLSQLEFYSVDGHDPWSIPEVSSLEPAAA